MPIIFKLYKIDNNEIEKNYIFKFIKKRFSSFVTRKTYIIISAICVLYPAHLTVYEYGKFLENDFWPPPPGLRPPINFLHGYRVDLN